MEIRARYVRMGAFTLAVIAAGFAFVYWLQNVGGLGERALYRIRFESSVAGLLKGSGVLFNGIRVGEVTSLELDPANPRRVQATIAVEKRTPVRADTAVGIDFQGLMGSPVIALTGGTSAAPLTSPRGETPLLVADPAAGKSMSQAAREVLQRLDTVVAENAQPLRSMIANLDTFSGALARNSNRLDGIVAGLERMTGGAAGKARAAVYDLTVPTAFPQAEKVVDGQLVVPDPTALAMLDSERILVRSDTGAAQSVADAQWSDAVPRMLQMKVIRAFENAGTFAAVSRPVEGLAGDWQLLIDIRRFQLGPGAAPAAEVEFAAKVVDASGRILDTRIIRATEPAASAAAPAATAALDQAFGKAATELVTWTTRTVADRAAAQAPAVPPAAPKGAVRPKPPRG